VQNDFLFAFDPPGGHLFAQNNRAHCTLFYFKIECRKTFPSRM